VKTLVFLCVLKSNKKSVAVYAEKGAQHEYAKATFTIVLCKGACALAWARCTASLSEAASTLLQLEQKSVLSQLVGTLCGCTCCATVGDGLAACPGSCQLVSIAAQTLCCMMQPAQLRLFECC
jgi:hypothetical protein